MTAKIITKFTLKKGKEIVFRYPQREDAPFMRDYINTLSKEETFISFQGEQLTLDEEQERLDKLLEKINNKTAVQILVFCGSNLIGISDLVMRDKAEKHVGSFGITLAKEFRGLGIGEKLMQYVLSLAIENIPQLKIIVLGCFRDNPIAQRLYKKMGFKQFGFLPKGLMHQGHLDDHLYLYKKV